MDYEVMLDLETLGTSNEALIIAIGAVKFTDDEILDRFHVAIEPATAEVLGGKIDASTVMWWLDPVRAAARDALLSHSRVDLASALVGFAQWFGEPAPIYGNGSTFDNIILRSAFRGAGLEYPAPFWMDRCYRTLKNEFSMVPLERVGVHHDAVDDAESQARHLQAIRRHKLAPVTMVKAHAETFRFYETQHRNKQTVESDEKAEINRDFAEKAEALADSYAA